jgi:hypothetical protein
MAAGIVVTLMLCAVAALSGSISSSGGYASNGSGFTPVPTMTTAAMMVYPTATMGMSAMMATPMPTMAAQVAQAQQNAQVGQPTQQPRLVIRNANLSVIVADPEAYIGDQARMADTMGGWVVTSSTSTFNNSRGELAIRGSITLRVPAERLDEALSQIRGGAIHVLSQTINGQDVTQEDIDTRSHIRNLEAAETQLQALMDRAEDVEEIMAIYTQLVQTRDEIEVARGRIQYFAAASAYSSIAITVEPEAPAPVAVVAAPPPGWNPFHTLSVAYEALLVRVQQMIDWAIIQSVNICPLAVVIGVPALLVGAMRRRKRQQVTPITIMGSAPE